MTGSNSSAGVYTKEFNHSQRVAAATSSVGVIVSASARGPVMETTLTTSKQEILNLFGKPMPRISKAHYCALEFMTQSTRLYFTRVVGAGALTACALLSVDDATAQYPQLDLAVFKNQAGVAEGLADPFNTYSFDSGAPGIGNIVGMFCAANPGVWNSEISVKVKPSTKRGAAVPDQPKQFYVEVYLPLSASPVETWLVTLDFSQDGFGTQLQIESVINKKSAYIRFLRNPDVSDALAFMTAATCTLNGGADGAPVTEGQIMQGWDLYADPEQLDCNILINGGYASPAVHQKMNEIAVTRRDSIAILDFPSDSQSIAGAIAYRRDILMLDTSYAAIYGPDLKIKDSYNDLELMVPASGHVASVYARTDNNASLWFAPAGMNRGFLEVLGVAYTYNQPARDAFEEVQINPIRVIPSKGFYVWGADTLTYEASALTNVPVRRLMNFMEKSIALASLYSVFDPNDSFLWMTLSDICERFLTPIRNAEGLYWFEVVCDERNNTAATIGAGDVNLDVYLDPTIFAKRIKLNAIINKTGVTFTGAYA